MITDQHIIEGLQHDDPFVRSGMICFLDSSKYASSTEPSHTLLDMLEKYGWKNAFHNTGLATNLPIDENVMERVIEYLANPKYALPRCTEEMIRRFACLGWIAKAPRELCASHLHKIKEVDSGAENQDGILSGIRFRIRLGEKSAAECRVLLDEQMTVCIAEKWLNDESISRIESICERLAEWSAVDRDWIDSLTDQNLGEETEEHSEEEIKALIGLALAKYAKMPVEWQRCREFLKLESEILCAPVVAMIGATVAKAEDLLPFIDLFPSSTELERFALSWVFEEVRFPETEEPLREIALLETDEQIASQLARALVFYRTESGLNAARQICDESIHGDEMELQEILYAVQTQLGQSSPKLEKWRESYGDYYKMFLDDPSDDTFPSYQYDPLIAPDPEKWLAMDEGERMVLARYYASRCEGHIEGLKMHASLHVVVENQIAMEAEDTPTRETVDRLMNDGLNRHEAIHAVCSILIEQIHSVLTEQNDFDSVAFAKGIHSLDAAIWVGAAETNKMESLTTPTYSAKAVTTQRREAPKVGRNDPCPCGSGKKYKQCCLKFAN